MPRVSIIIPCYNTSRFLGEAVQSVLDQTYPYFEVIIVDDGSIDNTAEVARQFTDPRVRYIYQTNKGLAGARNTGIREATGQYIAFLDADDLFLPHKLSSQVEFLEHNPEIGLVSGGWIHINEEGKLLNERKPWKDVPDLVISTLLIACPFLPISVLMRRDWLIQIGMFVGQLMGVEDWDLWLRLAHAGCRMEWQEEIVCYYRLHSANMSKNAAGMKAGGLKTLDNFFSNLADDDPLVQLKAKAYGFIYWLAFGRALAERDATSAVLNLCHAVQLDPELCANDGEQIVDTLANAVDAPHIPDPEQFLKQLLAELSNEFPSLGLRRREFVGLVHMSRFYRAYESSDWSTARRSFPYAVIENPNWLFNRGAVRMWLDALVGRETISSLLSFVSRPPSRELESNGKSSR